MDQGWMVAAGTAMGFAAGLLLGVVIAGFAGARVRRWRARRLAERNDRSGRALLHMAEELETRAAELHGAGLSLHAARRWARICRHAAGDHLASINYLMLVADETGPQSET